jgi:hypothetical protein
MVTRTKAESRCCHAPAKVNLRDGGYFCTKCGGDTTPVERKQAPRSTLSPTRKVTGERELMVQLWAKQKGKCAVTGDTLLPPEHTMFHAQGSHLLPKGTYPEDRLNPMNMVMITVEKHNEWHAAGDKSRLVASDKRWKPVVDLYDMLLERAKKRKPWQVSA